MANVLQMPKQNFLRTLGNLNLGSSSTLSGAQLFRTIGEFLRNVFDFCRLQSSANLNDEEKHLVISRLSDALPIIESGLRAAFLLLDADQRLTAKIYRSAVQFLVDGFRHLNVLDNTSTSNFYMKRNLLSEGLTKLLNCDPVESLIYDLDGWADDNALGEFPYNIPPSDITNVPNKHS